MKNLIEKVRLQTAVVHSGKRISALVLGAVLSLALTNCAPSSSTAQKSTKGAPSQLSYAVSPAFYPVGSAITPNLLSAAQVITGFSISPALPAGLSFDTTNGTISGTPTVQSAPATYTITAKNGYGSNIFQLLLSITDVAPTMTYGGAKTLNYTVGTAVSTITPTLGGGATVSCFSNPGLPAGLNLSSQCVLSGTPTQAANAANYVISANNTGGSAPLTFNLTVTDLPPNISYAGGPYTYNRGKVITTLTPSSTGGVVTTCTSSPALPAGLALSSACAISGTPSALAAAANYTITGTNNGGTVSRVINVAVVDAVPIISYPSSPVTFTKGSAISPVNVSNSGGYIVSCASAPGLPAGLSLSSSCQVTGTPTALSGATVYSITATNTAGSSSANLSITVNDTPPTLSYPGNPYTYTVGTAITPINGGAVNNGGAITNCSSSPALPGGITLNTSNCFITGTPSVARAAANYAITATNSGGTATVTINLTVKDTAPGISYSGSPFTFYRNSAITAQTPSNSGTAITTCTSSPSLPSGLLLSTSCVISGTPTALSPSASYTITGSNSAGSSSATINISVIDTVPAITFAGSPYSFNRNSAITPVTPANGGGAITSCTSAPALPSGLSLGTTDCTLSGTPTVLSAAANYTITAANGSGTSAQTISIAVTNNTPPVLSYPSSPYGFTVNVAITPVTVTNTGGASTSCSVSPALPAGLALNTTDCTLTGTPTAITAAANYTVSATNASGTGSAIIRISINDVAPNINYNPTSYNFTYTAGTPIAALTPNNTGGVITSCASSPSLPAGLSLSNANCSMTGTPAGVRASANYIITATNSGGSSSQTITITVNDVAPSISYAGSPFSYTKGITISTLTPANGGGAITSCSVNPALPGGIALSNLCVLSGTPTGASASANYTITATNSGGSSFATINITVADTAPAFSYAGSPFTYTRYTAIATLTPTSTGGAITSCASSPALPSGLNLSSSCVLTGTPTGVSTAANYTITGTNTGGSASAVINVRVNDAPPVINYSGGPFVYTQNTALTPLTPSSTGGSITSCATSPALPAGLSLANSNCAISGTPTGTSAAANYAITATGPGGTGSQTINITVNNSSPAISYPGGPFSYTKGVAISALNPASSGGAISSCAISPALPAGLSISNACVVTGTPTVLSGSASYTVTATNGVGTGTAVISVTINDVAPNIDYIPTSYSFTYTRGVAIAALTPNNGGGAITSCSASPALPAGLSLSNANCSMTGTPSALHAISSFTITATNTGGSSSQAIQITVNDAAPTLSYAGSPYTFTNGTAIATLTPTNTGGAITSCSISPNLPGGLAYNSSCVISGTPGVASPSSNYTITATNSGGTASATINIRVNDVAPTLSYAGSPFTYVIGNAIATLNPTNTGGAYASCASSPALPGGLNLSSGCVISGTPSVVVAAANYTITGTNTGGSASATINIKVNNGPPILSYPGGPFVLITNNAANLTGTNTGGVITSCASAPGLPLGLSLSNTCAISGTPTVATAAANYVITGTNAQGSSAVTINLTVNDAAPVLGYSPATLVFTQRISIATVIPTNSGGLIASCSSSPALPAGLTLATNCRITGTPTALSAASNYIITATNTGGSSSTTISIRVKHQPQILFYGLTALNGAMNGTAPSSQNLWKISLDGVDRLALTSNSNNLLDSLSPSFSADGTQVVSYSKRAVNGSTNGTGALSYNIFTSTATGSSPVAATANTLTSLDSDDSPSFSSDGTKVVFASKTALTGAANGTPALSYNIWIMNPDGTGKVALTSNTVAGLDSHTPVFSPDGTTIYFSSKMDLTGVANGTATSSFNIWKMNVNGTGKTALTNESAASRDSLAPKVSSDGTLITYYGKQQIGGSNAGSNNIWVIGSNGAGRNALTVNTGANLDSTNPSFSPDGTEIVFASKMQVAGTNSGSYNIWKMAVSGASQVALTTNTGNTLDSTSPTFSPDGSFIAFSSKMNLGATPASSANIFVMNQDGTGQNYLTSNTAAGLDSYLGPNRIWYIEP